MQISSSLPLLLLFAYYYFIRSILKVDRAPGFEHTCS